jgi:hypothetical protein
MPTRTWKHTERAVAAKLGGKRQHFEAEDISHPIWSVQVKHRSPANYPKRVSDWLNQARVDAPEGKIPLLVIHLSGDRHGEDMVVMRMSDFEEMFGNVRPKGAQGE